MQTLFTSSQTSTDTEKIRGLDRARSLIEFRNLQNRFHLGARAAKIAVIFGFTVCWLLIILVRTQPSRNPAVFDGSSLMGLAASLQQGAISGRDFQSMYGPAAQFLAGIATSVTATQSALGASGMMVLFFCAASALLMAATLLICDRLSWQQCATFYTFSLALNLFFDVFDIRTVLLLLSAVLAYRTIVADTLGRQSVWATVTGLTCFVSQLVSLELGIYAAIAVVCSMSVGSILSRSAIVLLAVEVFAATLATANLGLVILFKLSSSSYRLLFDYHNYGLEILRGYHNNMGMFWGLPLPQSIILAAVALYVVVVCVASAWRSDSDNASLLASLAFAAVIWVTTAFVRSDIPQIVFAFTPVVVILTLLAPMEWESRNRRAAWIAAACALLFVWPSLNFSAPADLLKIVRGQAHFRATARSLYAAATPIQSTLGASLMTGDFAEQQNVPVLAYPYDNYVSIGLRRPFFAPVLESYAASTSSLQDYYVRAIDRQRRTGLDIVYGLDPASVPPDSRIQAITRAPIIFEYLYKYFELADNHDRSDGHYLLRPRREPRSQVREQMKFSVRHRLPDSGMLELSAVSACGLLSLDLSVDYWKNTHIFKPGGIRVNLVNNNQLVWQGSISSLDQRAAAYISPLPPAAFHKVFGEEPVQGVKWNRLVYYADSADLLGSAARRIEVNSIQCIDPARFAAAALIP